MNDKLSKKRSYKLLERQSAGTYIKTVYATDITLDKAIDMGASDMELLIKYFIWDFADCAYEINQDKEASFISIYPDMKMASYVTVEESEDKRKVLAITVDELKGRGILKKLPPTLEASGVLPKIEVFKSPVREPGWRAGQPEKIDTPQTGKKKKRDGKISKKLESVF